MKKHSVRLSLFCGHSRSEQLSGLTYQTTVKKYNVGITYNEIIRNTDQKPRSVICKYYTSSLAAGYKT